MPPTCPFPDDDDAAAEALAAELEARALRDPSLARAILRRLQTPEPAAYKAPAEMSLDELAQRQGTDRFTLRRIAHKAIHKLRHTPEIRSLKP
jgi:DNA-directed RNA polymerase sigma subunit (sigma70/sigma32)